MKITQITISKEILIHPDDKDEMRINATLTAVVMPDENDQEAVYQLGLHVDMACYQQIADCLSDFSDEDRRRILLRVSIDEDALQNMDDDDTLIPIPVPPSYSGQIH